MSDRLPRQSRMLIESKHCKPDHPNGDWSLNLRLLTQVVQPENFRGVCLRGCTDLQSLQLMERLDPGHIQPALNALDCACVSQSVTDSDLPRRS